MGLALNTEKKKNYRTSNSVTSNVLPSMTQFWYNIRLLHSLRCGFHRAENSNCQNRNQAIFNLLTFQILFFVCSYFQKQWRFNNFHNFFWQSHFDTGIKSEAHCSTCYQYTSHPIPCSEITCWGINLFPCMCTSANIYCMKKN